MNFFSSPFSPYLFELYLEDFFFKKFSFLPCFSLLQEVSGSACWDVPQETDCP